MNNISQIMNSTYSTISTFHFSNLMTFTWIDYGLFFGMFVFSALIGIYFGCFGTKQTSIKEYLLGGKNMSIFPIAMSLIASSLSGITLLGMPAEVYMYGTQIWACIICILAVIFSGYYIYLPVFYKLQVNSSYEYLMMRFDQKIRNLTSIIFVIKTIFYIPIVIYIPALAFNQVTGINLHIVTPIVCVICIFYTTLGGLKAVVWTDTLQFSITMMAMSAVFYMGTESAGGVKEIWKKSEEGDRIEFFNLNLDPTERCTFWNIAFGLSTTWIAHLGIHQANIQRYLSLPSLKSAKRALLIFGTGVIITKSLSIFSGLIMYAKYTECDPITSGKVRRMDQLLPFYVLDVAKTIPGLSGIFISGVFSTALSTMSTSLNTLAGTIYEDFLVPNNKFTSDKNGSTIMKVIVVIVGSICVGMVFLIEKLGGVLQIFMTFAGLTGGPMLGLFTLGMLFPSANTQGAAYGCIISFLFVLWMCIGQQINRVNGNLPTVHKPLSVEGCVDLNITVKSTVGMPSNMQPDLPFWLYRVSFYWYSFIAFTLVLVIGLLVSYFTKDKNAPPVSKDLLSPCIYSFLPKDYPNNPVKKYTPVESTIIEYDKQNNKIIVDQ